MLESKVMKWLNSPLLNELEKKELEVIRNDEVELNNRFGSSLSFGTGGLRGVMELGTNRMNRFVVCKAAQGISNYLNKTYQCSSIAISYDSRNNSKSFAIESAKTYAANGIKVFLFAELMPTPVLSFAVRYLKCQAGIMVTASHNPRQYNGYKVYGDDGCQITVEASKNIYHEISLLDEFDDVKTISFEEGEKLGLITYIKDELVDEYLKSTLSQSLFSKNKDIKISYTPLYGAGYKCVPNCLRLDGFNNVHIVEQQSKPNGDFPTCPYPNPEFKEALALGIEQLLKENDDILIATDPDCDRVGVVINHKGTPIILNGNEVGILLFDFIYHTKKELGLLKEPLLVKTIVSSDMVNIMAKYYGVQVNEVLTGFKYIGEQILFLEKNNQTNRFLLGFEESCGYLTNTNVRDKDAVNACLLVAEMTSYYLSKGQTLKDHIDELYDRFGYYKTSLLNYQLEESTSKEKIASIMSLFRSEEVHSLFPNIDHIGDYDKQKIFYKDHEEETNLPKSDVIKLFLDSGTTVTLRPSGTEPKFKVYIFSKSEEEISKITNLMNRVIG